ncbi:MAG: hypothetical protein ACR2JQ_09615 [Mycobacteriales bacterium]
MLAIAVGAVAVLAVRGHDGGQHAPPLAGPTTTASTAGATTPPPTSPRTASADPTSVGPTSSSPRPPPAGVGEHYGLVTVVPAAVSQPQVAEVATLLDAYFKAINSRDYAAWRATLTTRTSPSAKQWYGLHTTTESHVTLYGVTANTDGTMQASVAFTSHQAKEYGPDGELCTEWTPFYPVVNDAGRLRIDKVDQSNVAHNPCAP